MDRIILNGILFDVFVGKSVVIVGMSGSGNSF